MLSPEARAIIEVHRGVQHAGIPASLVTGDSNQRPRESMPSFCVVKHLSNEYPGGVSFFGIILFCSGISCNNAVASASPRYFLDARRNTSRHLPAANGFILLVLARQRNATQRNTGAPNNSDAQPAALGAAPAGAAAGRVRLHFDGGCSY